MNSGITLSDGPEVSPRAARAHEMKNCLSVILAIARLMERELSHESRTRMGRLQSASLRLRDLVAEDLREERSGVHIIAPGSTCCVMSLVEQTTERVSDRAAEARVELFVQCGGGELHCDERALREALFNLIVNAIEASPAGGAVFVATYVTSGGDQYWAVQDSGDGIPAERLTELGRSFHSTKIGGLGLGLALVRTAVALHGGRLRVESRAGAGTTVSVWLPHRTVQSASR
jgi:two-component system sensor histidine kinase HydH